MSLQCDKYIKNLSEAIFYYTNLFIKYKETYSSFQKKKIKCDKTFSLKSKMTTHVSKFHERKKRSNRNVNLKEN